MIVNDPVACCQAGSRPGDIGDTDANENAGFDVMLAMADERKDAATSAIDAARDSVDACNCGDHFHPPAAKKCRDEQQHGNQSHQRRETGSIHHRGKVFAKSVTSMHGRGPPVSPIADHRADRKRKITVQIENARSERAAAEQIASARERS